MSADVDVISILLIDDNPGDRRIAEIALKEGERDAQMSCHILSAGCLRDGLALLTAEDAQIDAIILDLGLPDASGFEGLRRLRNANPAVPIVVLTGQPDLSMAIAALKRGANDYLEKGEIQPKALWRAIRYAIERKQSEADLLALANTDPLTGLLNRRAFFGQLEAAIEQSRRSQLACAIVAFDLDNFKEVNDVFGHQAGDNLLVEIARRVRGQIRKTDSAGRLGGDEFAVVAPNLKSGSGAIEIAEKIKLAVATIDELDGVHVKTSISIGIAVFPMDDSPADVLVSHADMAMYRSKGRKSGPINFYDEEMDRQVKARHVIKKSMLGDIASGKFFLHYQPIVDTQTYEIVAAEGLARWRNQNDEVIAPGEFIPIAEETGWISALGARLLEDACAYIQHSVAGGRPTVPISLNLSTVQCRNQHFALQLVSIILRYGIDPHLINFEITESAIIQNIDMTRRNIGMLKDIGIGVHIDDFGTGYSSLSILRDLPLDVLKVDRSFVSAMTEDSGAHQIVEAIAELSRRMRFKTIAEGVETEEQALRLREIGIDYLQGFYFSPPVRLEEFRRILDAGTPLGIARKADAALAARHEA
ncbi:MAG TPA: EAL domain-containing protein [Devosiaceae bacterium]|nr:EAL domain-containing protein [Devosiaceae bacterium]